MPSVMLCDALTAWGRPDAGDVRSAIDKHFARLLEDDDSSLYEVTSK